MRMFGEKLSTFDRVIEVFEQDSGEVKVSARLDGSRLFIESEDGEAELMLRIDRYYSRLIIARICFKNQRSGFGAKLLQALKAIASDEGFAEIHLEQTFGEAITRFAQKHGFTGYGTQWDDEYRNWMLKI